mmetsp:Transcript_10284/g.15364  ORF Transcript_10284/g.15364 Transcript_10284/m.15364 type:complete len:452 (+) Transcript_10284:26-1381(+)
MKATYFLVFCFAVVSSSEDSNQKSFIQTRNHFHLPYQEGGSFTQRYWVIDQHWDQANGPIFLYLCGASSCNGLHTDKQYVLQVAKEFRAKVVVLEHRYYGASLPYFFASMLPQLFFYHDVQQAMTDVAQFIFKVNEEVTAQRRQFGGGEVQWVTVGGGYAGAMSAWLRTRYPDLIVAAWASSATVVPILDFKDFDKGVYEATFKSGESCVEAIRKVNALVEKKFLDGEITQVTDLTGTTQEFQESEDMTSVLYYITDMMANLVVEGSRTKLCSEVTKSEDDWQKLRNLVELGKSHNLTSPSNYAISSLKNLLWYPEVYGRQWYWQKCTQLGWFQTPSEYNMRSSLLNITYWENLCNDIFDYPGSIDMPDTEVSAADLHYTGQQIVFTYGEEDPWKHAGHLQQLSSSSPVIRINCTDCSHGVDLKTPNENDPQELKEARQQILDYLEKWLRD